MFERISTATSGKVETMKQQHAKSAIFVLFMVILFDALGWGIVYPSFEPVILNNLTGLFSSHASVSVRDFWYEAMVGIYMLFMFIMSPLLGSLSDRYGRKIILIISMAGNAVGFLISGIGLTMNSLLVILIGRAIAGATAGSLPIAQAAMMDISNAENKPKYLSMVAFANLSGFALGPALGALFLDQHIFGNKLSYSSPFWATMMIGLLGALLVSFVFKETFNSESKQKISIFAGIYNLRESIKVKKTRRLCLIFFYFMLGWAMFFSLIPLLLAEKFNWQASHIGAFISFAGLFLGLGVIFFIPRLVKIARVENIISLSLLVLIIATVLFPLIHHAALLWLLVIFTMASPFVYVGLASLFSTAISTNEQGKIMGVIGSLVALTWGIGPMMIGYIAGFGFATAYLVTGLSFLSALVLFSRYFYKKVIMDEDNGRKSYQKG